MLSIYKSVPDSKEKEESLEILSLSYNFLPSHLKPCFLYMGVFREDSNIHISKIIKLWIAEGFIRPNNTHTLEEVALQRTTYRSARQNNWSAIDGQFPRLEFLKTEAWDLEYSYADKSHFPVLEKLVLINMLYLEEVPSGVGEIAALELIRMVSCSNSATISVVKIKEDRLENEGNDILRIEVVVDNDSELVPFEKMVEREGLTVDNIQLERR